MRDANDDTTCESSGVALWRDLLHWTDSFGRLTTLARSERKKEANFKLESDSNTGYLIDTLEGICVRIIVQITKVKRIRT